MSGRRLMFGFFVPRSVAGTFDEACARLGLEGPGFGPLTRGAVRGESTEEHHLVEVYVPEDDFIALREAHEARQPVPLAADGALSLAQEVRRVAVRAGAMAAVVITHPDQATPAWLREHEWMVSANDAISLAGEYVGLLWLADVPDSEWAAVALRAGRDELPDGPGRTLFAGREWSRWY